MNTKEYQDEQLTQLTRHLYEWNNNTTLEAEARYFLGGKHRYEHQCLAPGKFDSTERGVLIARHVREIDQLKQFNSDVRIAIEERHLREKIYLKGLVAY